MTANNLLPTDLVSRLRHHVVWEPEVGQIMQEAANEIERLRIPLPRHILQADPADTDLRNNLRLARDTNAKLEGEVARLRLTAAEREAIDRARRAFRDMDHNSMTMQQVEDYEALCGLLERFPSALSPMSLPPQPEDGDEEGEQ